MNLRTTSKYLTIREQYEMLDSLIRSLMPTVRDIAAKENDLWYVRSSIVWELGDTLGVDYNVQIAISNSGKSDARYVYQPYIKSIGWQRLDRYRMSVGSWSIPF